MSAYEITKITSQEELLLAVKEEKPVIEITGELYDTILATSQKTKKAVKNSFVGCGVLLAVNAVIDVLNPVIGLPAMLYGLKKGVDAFGSGLYLVGGAKKVERRAIDKYKLFFHPAASELDRPVFLLIQNKFDLKYNTLVERPTCCFYDKKCTHCGSKIKDFDRRFKADVLPSCCEECQRPIFYKLT